MTAPIYPVFARALGPGCLGGDYRALADKRETLWQHFLTHRAAARFYAHMARDWRVAGGDDAAQAARDEYAMARDILRQIRRIR